MHESFEAVTQGERFELGTCELTAEEMREFASRYDPQRFHLEDDPEGPFGGLVASGWQTAAVTMGLLVRGYLREAGTVGSPGVQQLRWETPVRPGDRLSATLTIGEREVFDDNRGLVHQEIETTNQDDERVMWMDALVLYPRDDTGGSSGSE
jgi:acyl dehydratase